MFLNEMYKIEKILHSYRMSGITDIRELSKLSDHYKLSVDAAFYYRRAIVIPYFEMLQHIVDYNKRDMEETTEMHWWDDLHEQYNKIEGRPILFTVDDTISRFKDVERLSKSLIFGKKMEKLLDKGSNEKEKKLVRVR